MTTKSHTTLPKQVVRKWHVIDVSSKPMGRIATQIANWLRGKHKRDFTPHIDGGDFVVAVNVDKLQFTGRKVEQKVYYRHSKYLGGLKEKQLKHLVIEDPEWVLQKAVKDMLDDVRFRPTMLKRLKMVRGDKPNFSFPA